MYLSIEEASKMLKMSKPTLRHLIEQGQIKGTAFKQNKTRKSYWITKQAVENFVKGEKL